MPRTLVIRDPQHPDFPHGTTVGKSRKCPCELCGQAQFRHRKRLRREWADGRFRPHGATPEVVEQVRRHCDQLRAAGMTWPAIGAAIEAHHSTVPIGLRKGGLSPRVAEAVLALRIPTREQPAKAGTVSVEASRLRVMQLAALGYPVSWIAKQAKVNAVERMLYGPTPRKFIQTHNEARIRALHESIGDRPATPDLGIPAKAITVAKRNARMRGYYPPAFYDADGTLDWRAIPDHPWARISDEAIECLDRLTLVLAHPGLAGASLATEAGYPVGAVGRDGIEKAYDRMVTLLGVRESDPDATENRRELQRLMIDFRVDYLDPVTVALDLGLLHCGHVPRDHPTGGQHPSVTAHWRREALRAQARRRAGNARTVASRQRRRTAAAAPLSDAA